jgi:predicted RNA-binding protein YlxR (DUF448 family)
VSRDHGRTPIRTCAGCRIRAPKQTLIRVVRTPEGARLDPAGRREGRGAYLHPHLDCVERGLSKGGLARALRAGVVPEELGRLRDEIEREMESA